MKINKKVRFIVVMLVCMLLFGSCQNSVTPEKKWQDEIALSDNQIMISAHGVPKLNIKSLTLMKQMGLTNVPISAKQSEASIRSSLQLIREFGMTASLEMENMGAMPKPFVDFTDWAEEFGDVISFIYYCDEPTVQSFSTLEDYCKKHDEVYANKASSVNYFVNLFHPHTSSYFGDEEVLGFEEDENGVVSSKPASGEYYLDEFARRVMSKTKNKKIFSIDHYPLLVRSDKQTGDKANDYIVDHYIDKYFLSSVEMATYTALKYKADLRHFYIQTTGFWKNYNGWWARTVNENDVRFQFNSLMTYGAQAFTLFTYQNSTMESYTTACVDDEGNPLPLYGQTQKVLSELKAFQNVYLGFDWQGVKSYLGQNNTSKEATYGNESFMKLEKQLDKLEGISKLSATEDTIVGEFKQGDKLGYMITNYTDPFYNKTDEVSLDFASDYDTVVVFSQENPQGEAVKIEGNSFSVTLQASQGVFIIPLKLG